MTFFRYISDAIKQIILEILLFFDNLDYTTIFSEGNVFAHILLHVALCYENLSTKSRNLINKSVRNHLNILAYEKEFMKYLINKDSIAELCFEKQKLFIITDFPF